MATDLELLMADLQVIEEEILPDLRRQLAELTSPEYKAEENPDHELRDQDIEQLREEIRKYEKLASKRRKSIQREKSSSVVDETYICSLGHDMRG